MSLGLCVVTTRYGISDLRAYRQTTAPMHELPRLSTAAGVNLLWTIGVRTGSQADFEKLVEDVDGHALTLQILGQFLVRAFHGDIRSRDRIDFQKADARIQGGHAFRAMEAYVKWLEDDSEEARREVALLKLLGLFDRPATADCVAALRKAPAIQAVSERAAQTLKIAEQHLGLLAIALDHLTLGRAALYAAILKGSSLEPCHSSLQHAVAGLRRAGAQHYIPHGLLTRAWLRSLEGPRTGHESAQSDLDEAWEIVERGPMKLFMADVHLHRARLFFREAEYPWGSPAADLAAARALIEKCGYGRRKEELEDAEAAASAEAAARAWYRVSQKAVTRQVDSSEPTGAMPGSQAIHVPSIQTRWRARS